MPSTQGLGLVVPKKLIPWPQDSSADDTVSISLDLEPSEEECISAPIDRVQTTALLCEKGWWERDTGWCEWPS